VKEHRVKGGEWKARDSRKRTHNITEIKKSDHLFIEASGISVQDICYDTAHHYHEDRRRGTDSHRQWSRFPCLPILSPCFIRITTVHSHKLTEGVTCWYLRRLVGFVVVTANITAINLGRCHVTNTK
jgi:hypothetical protein